MRQHDEIEMKWVLRPEQAGALRRRLDLKLGSPRRLRQENRFFDTDEGHLRQAGCSLRLRRENDRILMTVKRRIRAAEAGLHRYREDEAWINPLVWVAVDRGQVDPRDCLPLPPAIRALVRRPLRLLGAFSNQRLEYREGKDLLCLDRTSFPGGREDHELELETCDPKRAPARWSALLSSWEIDHDPQHETKLKRFLGCLGI